MPHDTSSVTKGSVTVEGKRINYTATAGTIILRDRYDKPTGSMFYVAYVKDGNKNLTEQEKAINFLFHLF